MEHQLGPNCDALGEELTMGCSILQAAKRVWQQATSTITVTETLTPAMPTSGESCDTVTITVPQAFGFPLSSSYVTSSEIVQQVPSPLFYNKATQSEPTRLENSFMSFTTRTTYSSMSFADVVETRSSTLSSTGIYSAVSTISLLATPSPTSTGSCTSGSTIPAIDYHVFHPLIDLSLENSSSTGAITVADSENPNSENCAPFTVIYLPDRNANTCVRMTGEWTPRYSNVYYECIARVRAPEFDPENYLHSKTGLNFTSGDGAYSVVTSRKIGRRPERKYKQSSMMLFAPEDKLYNVEFWACGAGSTLFVSELSCTYYG